MICLQMGSRTTLNNDCDPVSCLPLIRVLSLSVILTDLQETLTYECLCGNNQRPNISEYSLTMPYYLCQEWGNQCVKKCNDNACASNCREQHPCGATDPKQYNITSSTSGTSDPTASQTGSGVIFTNSPGGSSANNSRGAGSTLAVGHTLSLPFLVSSLFAIFALLC